MAERFIVPNFEIEEDEKLTVAASVTGGSVTWMVRLRTGRLEVNGHLSQEAIDDADIDMPRKFMEYLRQKIDDL